MRSVRVLLLAAAMTASGTAITSTALAQGAAGSGGAQPAAQRAGQAQPARGASPAAAAATPAQGMGATLPVDPRVVSGALENGLAYKVVRHAVPPGRAIVWIHVSTGSLNETDRQRGIAHYLEHMAFNGSENFKPGELIPFFQSLGLTFGRHQNAFTSFDQTTYQLSLPDNKPESLDKALTFFADVAGRMLLLPAEIEEERQVIMEEKRTRLGAQQRVQEALLARLAPGSLLGQRLPIGVEETIMGVQEQDFRDYYGKYYVPANMTVMVVADMDEKAVVEQIRTHFAGFENKPRPADQDAGFKADASPRAIVITDPELTSASVSITRLEPLRAPTTTVEQYRRDLVEDLAAAAVNQRIDSRVAAGGTPYLRAGIGAQEIQQAMRLVSMNASGEPGAWKEMLEAAVTEARRAQLHGVTQRELDEARANLISNAEAAAQRESTLPAQAIIGRMNATVAAGEPFMSAQQRLELVRTLAPTITREEVASTLSSMADFSNAVFQLTTPSVSASGAGAATGVPSEQDLLQAGVAALKATPEAEKESAALGALMEKPPAPGTVAEQAVHAPSGVASAWFQNGVLVHHKFMDERKNTVLVRVTLAGSELLEDASTRGLTSGAAVGLARTATRTLSSTQVRELMAGKKAEVSASASPDAVTLSITASPEDLETGLQLAHLMITQPKIEGPAFEQWKTQRIQGIRAQEKTPMGQMQKALARTIYPEGEVRVTPLTEEQVAGLTLERSQQWLDTLMAQSPVEVSIVGDIPRERAMELAAKYLGSLPSRERISAETHDDRRALQRPKGPRVTDVRVPSQTPQAMVMAGFYGPDVDNVADSRAMQLAARVMSTRMVTRVREQEQLVYSIGAQASPGTAYPGFGLFVAGAPTDPAKAQRLGEVLLEMYAQFAKEGPTQEELDVAKKQFANTLDEEMKQPQWWLERTQAATYRGVPLDDVVALPEAMQAMTTQQVRDVFAKYWATDNSVKMTLVPEMAPAAEGGAAPAGGGGAAPKN